MIATYRSMNRGSVEGTEDDALVESGDVKLARVQEQQQGDKVAETPGQLTIFSPDQFKAKGQGRLPNFK